MGDLRPLQMRLYSFPSSACIPSKHLNEMVIITILLPLLGSANRKIDIFKITSKILLCVEVGLIQKTLSWNQILCIPYSANLKLLYQTSCISARWSASFADHHIWHTGTWLRGEHSGKCCSISCNSVVLQVTNC